MPYLQQKVSLRHVTHPVAVRPLSWPKLLYQLGVATNQLPILVEVKHRRTLVVIELVQLVYHKASISEEVALSRMAVL
jgi:hypothetical protein